MCICMSKHINSIYAFMCLSLLEKVMLMINCNIQETIWISSKSWTSVISFDV